MGWRDLGMVPENMTVGWKAERSGGLAPWASASSAAAGGGGPSRNRAGPADSWGWWERGWVRSEWGEENGEVVGPVFRSVREGKQRTGIFDFCFQRILPAAWKTVGKKQEWSRNGYQGMSWSALVVLKVVWRGRWGNDRRQVQLHGC